MSELIFAFDVGKASLGVCVRQGNDIKLLESLLIPAEFGDTSDLRPRRRAFRTREAHKKREAWLIHKWGEAGLEIPNRQSLDFLREFPHRGEEEIYNSALLRIALIQERPLAKWQIFKALWAAIQHRGYDPGCNWERPTDETSQDEDAKENIEALHKYEEALNYHIHSQIAYQFPCFLEASLMGLWNVEKPLELRLRISSNADRARCRVAPRLYVTRELKKLLHNAQKQIPALAGLDVDEWLYGPGREPYASSTNEFSKHRGTEWDAQGLLSQKVPRFDNRIIDKCRMLPKRNVCKANNELNIDFVIYQKLKNVRFRLVNSPDEALEGRLNPEQFVRVVLQSKAKIQTKRDKKVQSIKLSVKEIIALIQAELPDKIVDSNLKKEDEIRVNLSGRSNYCRPALEIMNRILIEGLDPLDPKVDLILASFVQADKPNGLTQEELEALRLRLGITWDRFHPGDRRMENFTTARQQTTVERERDVLALIGNVNNPVVRHRLTMIDNQLKSLVSCFGEPQRIMLEFVRGSQGLDSPKTASEWESKIKKNTKANDDIRKRLEEAELKASNWNIERYKLADEQGWVCPYTNEKLCISQLHQYDVDHIVPVSNLVATDAFYNKVLCISLANRGVGAKNDQTPHEWLSQKLEWDAYLTRITQRAGITGGYGPRKKALLTSPKARDLIDSYNGLAETAYVARLTQAMIAIRFAWPLGNVGEKRRIFINDGRITSKIRKAYKLNELLLEPEQIHELEAAPDIETRRKLQEKNRQNQKHHALDAYCISYAQQFRSESKSYGRVHWSAPWMEGSPGLEESKSQMEQKLKAMFPKMLRRNMKDLHPKDTIYGLRAQKENGLVQRHYLTVREDLVALLEKDRKKTKSIFDLTLREDLARHSEQISDNVQWKVFLQSYKHPVLKSRIKKVRVIEPSSVGMSPVDDNGRVCFGKFKDFGNQKTCNGKKGITLGQFKQSKANKGQLLVKEGQKWKVLAIKSHEKLKPILNELRLKDKILYQKGSVFYAGCHIYVPLPFKAGKIDLPAGNYISTSLESDGRINLKDSNGIEYRLNVNNLTAADFKLVK
jgi:CRISPR-associated endonuclease Csn1